MLETEKGGKAKLIHGTQPEEREAEGSSEKKTTKKIDKRSTDTQSGCDVQLEDYSTLPTQQLSCPQVLSKIEEVKAYANELGYGYMEKRKKKLEDYLGLAFSASHAMGLWWSNDNPGKSIGSLDLQSHALFKGHVEAYVELAYGWNQEQDLTDIGVRDITFKTYLQMLDQLCELWIQIPEPS